MKWLGYKQVAFKSIVMDVAEIRRRSKLAHVAELASDIRDAGEEPIHAPTIRAVSNELVCGRDRMAASLILKSKRLWVHVADCTDIEAKRLERRENIYRRADNRSQLIAEMVAITEQDIAADQVGTVSHLSGASKQTVKAEARKQVARSAGVSVAAVKKAEQRAKAEKVPPSDDVDAPVSAGEGRGEASPEAELMTLDLLGCLDYSARAVMGYARKDQEAIDKADKLLRFAQAALGEMARGTLQQQLYAEVHRLASRVRASRPTFICPWCRGIAKADFGECSPCAGLGYVSHEIAERAPRELLNPDKPMVAVHGKFVPYADALAALAQKLPKNGAAPAKKAKGMSVVTVDREGNETPVSIDGDEAY